MRVVPREESQCPIRVGEILVETLYTGETAAYTVEIAFTLKQSLHNLEQEYQHQFNGTTANVCVDRCLRSILVLSVGSRHKQMTTSLSTDDSTYNGQSGVVNLLFEELKLPIFRSNLGRGPVNCGGVGVCGSGSAVG